MKSRKNLILILWAASAISALASVTTWILYPDLIWAWSTLAAATLGALGALVFQYRALFRGRTAAFAFNSALTTLLILGILSGVAFLTHKFPQRADLTKNKVHTLSDQTEKLIRGLQQDVQITFFSKVAQRDEFKLLFDRYSALSTKFKVEYADPDKEILKLKKLGITQLNTAYIQVGDRDSKVEAPNEEKLTNALMKILRESKKTLCAITGHGERSFADPGKDGVAGLKSELETQGVDVKDIQISQAKDAKIDAGCDAVALIGPRKPLMDPELKVLGEYLANGGRALFAIDSEVTPTDAQAGLVALLKTWSVDLVHGIMIDPRENAPQLGAAALLIRNFSKDHPITADSAGMYGVFLALRPVMPLAQAVPGITVTSLAKSSPAAWGEKDLPSVLSGNPRPNPGTDLIGETSIAVAAEGRRSDSKSTRNTRLVVIGNSIFAGNALAPNGVNKDFMLNALSWSLEDESMISIRAKEDVGGRIEMSPQALNLTALGLILILPGIFAITALVIFIRRRSL